MRQQGLPIGLVRRCTLVALVAFGVFGRVASAAAADGGGAQSMWSNPGLAFAAVVLLIGVLGMSLGGALKDRVTVMRTQETQATESNAVVTGPRARFAVQGETGVSEVEVTLPAVIGRDAACDIVISDSRASGRHARVYAGANGTVEVEDLKSSNGVFVDGARIERVRLAIGSTIRIGASTLRYLA